MEHFTSIGLFMIVSFALAAVLILKKDTIPARVKRPLAIFTLIMVCSSFIMFMIRLFQMS